MRYRMFLALLYGMALSMVAIPLHAAQSPSAEREYRATMQTMHHQMMVTYGGQVDTDFARGMIPHHQGAVEMAETVLTYGNDATIRNLARWIRTAQQSEIAQMRLWLSRRALEKSEKPATIAQWNRVMEEMHRSMNITYSGDADVDFVCGMIPHHQGAVAMANIVLQEGRDPEMIALARGIIRSQSGEIAIMQRWLKGKGLVCKQAVCHRSTIEQPHHAQ
jgi:uncharacterized protein (DUF305 family)